MPDQSEVIMGQMEETRKDLTNKLETLEKQVAGTVETVTGTVEAVTESVESVKESIQETVASVTDTVEHTVHAVEETVENTVEGVKDFFNVSRQVDRHPWLMMGGSVLIGYLGGRLLTPRSNRARETSAKAAEPTWTPPSAPRHSGAAQESREGKQEAEQGGESWLHRLGDQFGDEAEKLKGLAVGTLFGVARDMIAQWLPHALKEQVTDVVNGFTTSLGGKVIREPIVAPPQQQEEAQHKDEGREPSRQPEPEATSSRKGEKAGGRSGRR